MYVRPDNLKQWLTPAQLIRKVSVSCANTRYQFCRESARTKAPKSHKAIHYSDTNEWQLHTHAQNKGKTNKKTWFRDQLKYAHAKNNIRFTAITKWRTSSICTLFTTSADHDL